MVIYVAKLLVIIEQLIPAKSLLLFSACHFWPARGFSRMGDVQDLGRDRDKKNSGFAIIIHHMNVIYFLSISNSIHVRDPYTEAWLLISYL